MLARQAAAVEDELTFEFGPPVPVKPGHEFVADLLMEVRRPGEAIPEFEASLKRHPGRALSLLGLYRAATAVKNTAEGAAGGDGAAEGVEPRRQDAAGAAGDRQRTDELVLRAWGLRLGARGLGPVSSGLSPSGLLVRPKT